MDEPKCQDIYIIKGTYVCLKTNATLAKVYCDVKILQQFYNLTQD